jgi:hypothetical protein
MKVLLQYEFFCVDSFIELKWTAFVFTTYSGLQVYVIMHEKQQLFPNQSNSLLSQAIDSTAFSGF